MKMNSVMKTKIELMDRIIRHSKNVKRLEYELSRKEDYYSYFKMSEYDLILHEEMIEYHKMKIKDINLLLEEFV